MVDKFFLSEVAVDDIEMEKLKEAVEEIKKRYGMRLIKKYEGKPKEQGWLIDHIFQDAVKAYRKVKW